jgi:hypothetical protein
MNGPLGTTLLVCVICYEVSFLMLLCLAIDDRCYVCKIFMLDNTLRMSQPHFWKECEDDTHTLEMGTWEFSGPFGFENELAWAI